MPRSKNERIAALFRVLATQAGGKLTAKILNELISVSPGWQFVERCSDDHGLEPDVFKYVLNK